MVHQLSAYLVPSHYLNQCCSILIQTLEEQISMIFFIILTTADLLSIGPQEENQNKYMNFFSKKIPA